MSKPIKAAVIGHPISHSKSPLIHNYWIEQGGLNGSYEAIDIAPENLKEGVQKLIDEGYAGFNVTIPHKEAIMDLCDDIDHNAAACGAVNTVVIEESGKLRGLNTDSFGFLTNIKSTSPDFDFEAGAAVVIGAGGAARAVVSGLIGQRIPEVILVNRTKSRAEKIAQDIGLGTDLVEVIDWEERHEALQWANLVVNASSLGMKDQPELDLNLDALSADVLVNDIVYNPLQTQLLKNASDRGNPTVTGIGMLLHQARPAFLEWFGTMPDVDDTLETLILK
ncbi:MAG: shikimate dehydrogenase [Bdellovibrionales bacterium]